ncbi:hypothetical protein BHM03_00048679 [Ensete ventricosum]|nr:hypothetical protein BHM03_00048679 [Ensete ventricosum]
MTSSPSLTIFGFTSSSSSSVPPPRVESCHPSGPAGDRSEPSSSSSGILTRSDIKAIRAMEIMKSHHDFDSTLSIESLVLIRKRFSILDEYALHAPLLEQCSYHEFPGGYSLSVDALEARLRFPLYSVIRECLSHGTPLCHDRILGGNDNISSCRAPGAFVLIGLGGLRSHLSQIWSKTSIRVKLRGVDGLGGGGSSMSILLLQDLEGCPRGCSARGRCYRRRVSTTRSLSCVQVRPRHPGARRPDVVGMASREFLLGSVTLISAPLGFAGIDLQKGRVGMRVPDMTPPTFKSVSPSSQVVFCVFPKKVSPLDVVGMILYTHQQTIVCTVGLTSIGMSSKADMYGRLASAKEWRKRHDAPRCIDGVQVGLRRRVVQLVRVTPHF